MMFINMTLAAQPKNFKWMIIALVVMGIYLGFLAALLTSRRAFENSFFQRALELRICSKLFFVCLPIATALRVVFFGIFFSPLRNKSVGLLAILSGPFNMVFRKMLSIGLNPFLTIATTFRRIAVPLRNLCARECHDGLILSYGGGLWQ